jgi:rhodanese-related sulfurtransferase
MIKIFLGLCFFALSLFADLKVVDNNQLLEMKAKGIEIIDIRRVDEWKKTGVIDGAKMLTFFDVKGNYDIPKWMSEFSQIIKDKNSTFVIYCTHANRTKMVGNFLNKELGYKNVYELKGGINYGWIDKGMKTIPVN